MEIPIMQDILGRNDAIATQNAQCFADNKVLVLNLLGSPGSGKTTLLEQTFSQLQGKLRLGIIEGDLFTDKDAERIAKYNIPVVQINTNGGCHLDALMVAEVLDKLPLADIDVLIVENVGNLVCPAEFIVGEDMKVTVLSITEGDDKPLKYPIIFKESDIALLNKIDLLPYTNFNLQSAHKDLQCIHPQLQIIETSATTKQGIDAWCEAIMKAYTKKMAQLQG